MKLAVLVAVVRVCPGIHKVRVRTWHDSEVLPHSKLHRLPVVRLPLELVKKLVQSISS